MDCSTPGLLVHRQLPKFTQIHVHWVGDAKCIAFNGSYVVYRYQSFFIHSSVDGHLGCFHVLAVINSDAMNIGVHVFFQFWFPHTDSFISPSRDPLLLPPDPFLAIYSIMKSTCVTWMTQMENQISCSETCCIEIWSRCWGWEKRGR